MNFKINNNERKGYLLNFKDIMKDVVKELDVDNDFLITLLKGNWEKIVGGIIATHSIPEGIFKNILFISSDHSTYANEIVMMKKDILQKIDDIIGCDIIKTINVKTKRLKW